MIFNILGLRTRAIKHDFQVILKVATIRKRTNVANEMRENTTFSVARCIEGVTQSKCTNKNIVPTPHRVHSYKQFLHIN